MSESVIEEYRKTLKALRGLRRKYVRRRDQKMLRLLDEEMDDVARTIDRLQKKGEKRWKW